MGEESEVAVIDNGSGSIKAGFSGDDAPRAVFTTQVGRYKKSEMETSVPSKDVFVGEDAPTKRGIPTLTRPIQRGIIVIWEDMEEVWRHIFYKELRNHPEEQPVLLSEPPLNPKGNREKTSQIMFESLNVPSMLLSVQAVLALYSTGRTTGLVLDAGYGVTHSVPVNESTVITETVNTLDLGGYELTGYLMRILEERGYSFSTRAEREIVDDIKSKLCYVCQNLWEECRPSSSSSEIERNYELPDGQIITVGTSRFRCPEVLFEPSLMGRENDGIHKLTHQSIEMCDMDIQRDLYTNTVLSGGSTMFPYLDERLALEMTKLAPASIRVKVVTPPERKYSVWIGGSLVSSLSTFSELCITKDEYDEQGPSVVHRKCP